MAASRIAVITGANKGIGLEAVKQLAAHKDIHCILTARDVSRGTAAVEELHKAGHANVSFKQLDVAEDKSVEAFAESLSKEHGRLDILLHNAGIAFKGDIFGAEEAKETININFHGAHRLHKHLTPLLQKSSAPRFVLVASQAGRLNQVSAELQERFTSKSSTYESLSELANEFIAAIADDTYRAKGWPKSMYGISKLLEIAYSKVLAREVAGNANFLVAAVCPGWCATDMSSHRGPRPASLGAETPVWLCLAPNPGSADSIESGLFWYDKAPIAW